MRPLYAACPRTQRPLIDSIVHGLLLSATMRQEMQARIHLAVCPHCRGGAMHLSGNDRLPHTEIGFAKWLVAHGGPASVSTNARAGDVTGLAGQILALALDRT